jgi:hypothetical protein
MRYLVLTLSLMLVSGLSNASDRSSGCGLGWQVANKNSLVSSFTRSAVNATFSNTIGMTLGTSGCSRHSIVQKDSEVIHYAEANFFELQKEMAEGQGLHLLTLQTLMGCESDTSFSSTVKNNYSNVFNGPETTPYEMMSNLNDSLVANNACATI